jgi:hypothetical protein
MIFVLRIDLIMMIIGSNVQMRGMEMDLLQSGQ